MKVRALLIGGAVMAMSGVLLSRMASTDAQTWDIVASFLVGAVAVTLSAGYWQLCKLRRGLTGRELLRNWIPATLANTAVIGWLGLRRADWNIWPLLVASFVVSVVEIVLFFHPGWRIAKVLPVGKAHEPARG